MSSILGPQTAIQRRLTRAFVLRDPVEVALEGIEEVPSLSGAKARTRLVPRSPVVVTLCQPSDSGYRGALVDERGSRNSIDFELVATYGTDVREGDEFDSRGHRYRVESMMVANDYEVRALVHRVR
jgi:hypothetical protein